MSSRQDETVAVPGTPESQARTHAFARVLGPFPLITPGIIRAARAGHGATEFFTSELAVWLTSASLCSLSARRKRAGSKPLEVVQRLQRAAPASSNGDTALAAAVTRDRRNGRRNRLLKSLSQAGFSVIADDLITIGRVMEQSSSVLTTTAIEIFKPAGPPAGHVLPATMPTPLYHTFC
jgi:hypothetical protein